MTTKLLLPLAALLATATLPTHAQMGFKGMLGKKNDAAAAPDTAKPAAKAKSSGPGFGSRLMSKAVMSVAKLSGNVGGIQQKTADLRNVVPLVYYVDKTNPADLGTLDMELYNTKWVAGSTNLVVQFTGKTVGESGAGMLMKIDGDVQVDGAPLEFASMGVYNRFGTDKKVAHKVDVSTSSGQKLSFTVPAPRYEIKLLSINGQKDNPTVDLAKDVTLEVAVPAGAEGRLVNVSIMGSVIGLVSFCDVGAFPLAKRVVVPAVAFRNLGNNPEMSHKRSFLQLTLAEDVPATNVSGPLPAVMCNILMQDGLYFSAAAAVADNKGLLAEGKAKLPDGPLTYKVSKGNAYHSRPVSELKKIGVLSFDVAGTTYHHSEKTSRLTNTTTTKTWTFPQVEAARYQAVLARLYPQVVALLQAELGATVVPLERVTSTAAYGQLAATAPEDHSSETKFTHSYPGTKTVPYMMPVSYLAGTNNIFTRIAHEAGVDALLKLRLNLKISEDGPELIPSLQFELVGVQNGVFGSTYFYKGEVEGDGLSYMSRIKDGNVTVDELDAITRRADLVPLMRQGLKEVLVQEKTSPDYEALWALRRGKN